MLEQFQSLDLFPVSVFDILTNLMVALLCGIIIALVYRFIYRGPSYSVTYVNSLVLLTIITSVIILVIGNNLARAFGLVGTMSIIRFRTAVRDVQDIVFLFFALAMGMAAGVGLHAIALSGTIVISIVAVVLMVFNFGAPPKREYLLQIGFLSTEENENKVAGLLKKHCKKFKLVNMKNLNQDNIEAFYHIHFKNKAESGKLLRDLNGIEDVNNVNIFFDEDDSDNSF
jgi:hypothetical protein